MLQLDRGTKKTKSARWRGKLRRQQKTDGNNPVWEGRSARLDPFSLPVRFTIDGDRQAADQAVYLGSDHAIIKRKIAGDIPLTVIVPIGMFEGVAAEFGTSDNGEETVVRLFLLHRDRDLRIPLLVDCSLDDIVADWRAWARHLSLPMLMIEADGTVRPLSKKLGQLDIEDCTPRRRHAFFADRRPRFLAKRKTGNLHQQAKVPGREIIARG